MEEPRRACPYCGSKDVYPIGNAFGMPALKCKKCGMEFPLGMTIKSGR